MALAIPHPGVLAEAPVDDQERPLPLVLGDRLTSLAIHLDVHEQRLLVVADHVSFGPSVGAAGAMEAAAVAGGDEKDDLPF